MAQDSVAFVNLWLSRSALSVARIMQLFLSHGRVVSCLFSIFSSRVLPCQLQKCTMSWIDDSQVGPKWKALKAAADAKDGQMPAADFADASLAIISVFDLISGMGMPASDMKGNANTVAKIASGAAAGATVNELILAEIDGKDAKAIGKIVGDGKTMSCAVLWLCR